MLADVFGCSFDSEESGAFLYLKPADPAVETWVAPQGYVGRYVIPSVTTGFFLSNPAPGCGMPRLKLEGRGRALATLSLPYGYPSPGNLYDHQWASIHSAPPWQDTAIPAVVTNSFGAGRSVYSVADIECSDGVANSAMFLGLVRLLLDREPSFGAETHPAVWMNAFDQPEHSRVMISFLNYQADEPAVPVDVRFSLRPPEGKRFTNLELAPDRRSLPFTTDQAGALHAGVGHVTVMSMVLAEYA